jgi:hypothetical protein
MKKTTIFLVFGMLLLLSSCSFVKEVFQTDMKSGILMVVPVIIMIFFVIMRAGKKIN